MIRIRTQDTKDYNNDRIPSYLCSFNKSCIVIYKIGETIFTLWRELEEGQTKKKWMERNFATLIFGIDVACFVLHLFTVVGIFIIGTRTE